MPRTTDRSLLPAALRARMDAGEVTNGEYHRLLRTLPDLALCDHVEVYLHFCVEGTTRLNPAAPAVYLHAFIVPEMVARLRGGHAVELDAPAPDCPLRPLHPDWAGFVARVEAAIRTQRRLGALSPDQLARDAVAARARIRCPWGPEELVYPGTVHHVLIPELVRRVAALRDRVRAV